MNFSNLTRRLLVVLLIASLAACKKDEPVIPPLELDFAKVLATGGSFGIPEVNTTIIDESPSTYDDGTHVWTCTTQTLEVNAASGGNDGFPLFDLASDVIYPGSMLQGNSLNSGNPNPIVVERAGGTISINILDGNLVSSFEVDQVKKSTITDAINNIIANATGTLPANFSIQKKSIQSRQEFALALGVDVNSTFLDLESNLNYNSMNERSTFLVSLNQSYYTMNFDLPTSLDQLFAPSVTPADLANYVGPNNPATYISAVTYGRIFYMLIETSSSLTDLEIAVNGAFTGVTTDVSGTLDVNYFSSLDEVSYSVFAYGGDAEPTFQAVGETDINALVSILGQSSSLGSAKPLSYVVRSVANNQVVATQLATTYDVVNCEITGAIGTIPSLLHWTGNSKFDDFGAVTAGYSEGDSRFILFNSQGQWLRSTFQNGEGLIEGPYNLSSNYPLNGVGAAAKIGGDDGNLVLFIDAAGTEYTLYNQDDATYVAPASVEDFSWGYGSHPFGLIGVDAVTYYPNGTYTTPGSTFPFPTPRLLWYSQGGENYVINRLFDSSYPWSPVYNVQQDWFGGILNGVMSNPGAGIGFEVGGYYYNVLFNQDGNQYVVVGDFNGAGNEVAGPFNL